MIRSPSEWYRIISLTRDDIGGIAFAKFVLHELRGYRQKGAKYASPLHEEEDARTLANLIEAVRQQESWKHP